MKLNSDFVLTLHRWLGLLIGVYFVLFGLSGSLLVYRDELSAWSQPQLRISRGHSHSLEIETATRSAQRGLGTEVGPSSIRLPERSDRNAELLFNMTETDGQRRRVTAFVDPLTHEYKGSEVFAETPMGSVFMFHHELFWGRTGRAIQAVGGILTLILLLGGIWVWWPKGSFLSGFRARTSRSYVRVNLELHRLAGIYSVVLLVVVTFTGVYLSRADWFPFLASSQPVPEAAEVTQLARGEQLRILPKGGTVLRGPGVQREETVREFQHRLHEGHFWGEAGRALVFVSGLLPLFFYITGFTVWRARQAARNTPRLSRSIA